MPSPPVSRLHPLPPPVSNTPAITKLQSLLRQLIRVETTDGRIFIGTFAGTDKPLNIILTNTEEYRINRSDELPDGRYVSLVMVPWKLVASIQAPSRWLQDQARSTSPISSMYF